MRNTMRLAARFSHRTRDARKRQMRFSTCRLGREARAVAFRSIVDHCRFRSWTLHAVNARSNHVHAVVSCDVHPKTAMSPLKAWATRKLRESGFRDCGEPVWAEGGSRRYLWTREELRRGVEYVLEYQGD